MAQLAGHAIVIDAAQMEDLLVPQVPLDPNIYSSTHILHCGLYFRSGAFKELSICISPMPLDLEAALKNVRCLVIDASRPPRWGKPGEGRGGWGLVL